MMITRAAGFCGCWPVIWNKCPGDVLVTHVAIATTECANIVEFVGIVGFMIWHTHAGLTAFLVV